MTAMRLLKHLAPWLLPLGLHAQLLTNNGAAITNSTIIQVNGGITNQGAGLLLNGGSIALTGDLIHNATNDCFSITQGTVVLNGDDQAIGGSNVAVFNNLELENSGTKTLQQDIAVGGTYLGPSGVLRLNDRVLDLNGHDLVVRNATPLGIQRTTGFIASERDPDMGYSFVRWNIGASAVGNNYVIPFGNPASADYLPFTTTITTAGGGINGWIAMATYPTDPALAPNNRPLPAGLPSLIDLSGIENAAHVLDRWWVLQSGGYLTTPEANISMAYRDSEWNTGSNTIVEGTLQLERFMGTWSMFPTVVNTTTNALASGGIPLVSSLWTAAELGAPLPVQMMSFTGERLDEERVELLWATATERENLGFEVWRMIDGEDEFEQIGWVDGAGSSPQLLHYDHVDANRTEHVSYYRLRQVDINGHVQESPVVVVQGMEQAASWVIAPNPARDRFSILGATDGLTRVMLMDGVGRPVREWHEFTGLSLDGVPAGVYVVHVWNADRKVMQQRLVVQ